MADTKISALTASTTPLAGTEVLPIVQSSTTKQVSVANLTAGRAVSALSFASTTGADFATTSGNVGVGVTASTQTIGSTLELKGGACLSGGTFPSMYLASNAIFNGGWTYKQNGYAGYYLQQSGTHEWNIATSGTAGNAITFAPAMTLNSGGSLLVGTTSIDPLASRTNGFVWVNSGTSSQTLRIRATSSAVNICLDTTSGANIQFFTDNGAALVPAGSITSNGSATLYNATSDYRLKNVIGAVTGFGERIDALKPIKYQWKDNGLQSSGFLAHEFQTVYADSVIGTKDAIDSESKPKYQAMQAGSAEVIADLVAEIQDLRKRLAVAGI